MKFCEKYIDKSYIEINDCRKIISLKDKRASSSKYVCQNENKKRVMVYKVDDGIIKSKDIGKCDYALYNYDDDIVFFIELKGSDYEQAIEQIDSTIRNLITSKSIEINVINARVVLAKVRTPEINTTKEIKLKILLNKYKGILTKQTRLMNDHI